MNNCRACDLGGILLALVLTRWGYQTETVVISHISSWSDRSWSSLSTSIYIPEMIISMLDNLSNSNAHWHYISYAKLHIVDNNSLNIRGRGIQTTCCPRKRWFGSFHQQKIALVLVKILYCFGAKAIGNLYRYFICNVPATKWPGHIVLPMSVIPKYFSCRHFFSLCFEILLTWYLVCWCIMTSYRSSLRFILVQWFLAELWPLDWKLDKYLVVTTFFSLWFEIF